MVGSQCLVSLHLVLCADHLPLQHPRDRGVRHPVLDRLQGAVALEVVHDPRRSLTLSRAGNPDRLVLHDHRDHHLEEGEGDGASHGYPGTSTKRWELEKLLPG